MPSKRSILSEETKRRFAEAQGVTPEAPGSYGNLTSRQAGNFVRLAIEQAEQQLRAQSQPQVTVHPPQR